jgi:hypothetical protein
MYAKIRTAVATAAIAATLFTPSVAQAGGGENLTEGDCSGAATWKMKLAEQNNRIDVEYEVDVNRRGQQWRVSVWHNGQRVVAGIYRTAGLSGSFSVNKIEADRAGEDTFRARAVRLNGAQTCGGRGTF